MFGFLGTVWGMILAFDAIEQAGDISPSLVANGIKVALITTVAGLIVAMVLSGFLGTVIGKHVLVKMNDKTFHRVLAVLLSLLALRLLYEGVTLLDLF